MGFNRYGLFLKLVNFAGTPQHSAVSNRMEDRLAIKRGAAICMTHAGQATRWKISPHCTEMECTEMECTEIACTEIECAESATTQFIVERRDS